MSERCLTEGGTGAEPDGPDVDNDLRALLEGAVPHLAAPPARMREIRERVARRRRRRSALAAVGSTLAMALAASAVLLGLPGARTAPVPPAAAGSPVLTAVGSPGSPSAGPGTRLDGTDLTVTLPSGWRAVPPNDRAPATYVTNQPVKRASCAKPTSDVFSCAPVFDLPEGGAVVAFQPGTPHQPGSYDTTGAISPDCRALGGDQEFVATGLPETYPGKSPFATDATICMRGWSGATLDAVDAMLTGARSSQGRAFDVTGPTPGVLGGSG